MKLAAELVSAANFVFLSPVKFQVVKKIVLIFALLLCSWFHSDH